jgi:hypothetical protein
MERIERQRASGTSGPYCTLKLVGSKEINDIILL